MDQIEIKIIGKGFDYQHAQKINFNQGGKSNQMLQVAQGIQLI